MSGRGGGWVVAQFILMAAVLLALFVPPRWPEGARAALAAIGTVVALSGAAVAVWAGRTLGPSFTPFPRPADEALLVERGPYGVVRHPVYAAGVVFFVGLSLLAGVVSLMATVALAATWALKARVEERHLRARFPGYDAYSRRVRWRLLPGIY